ncbi:MAG: hypothetical protein AVDCRST_MAG19-2513 [uncultured Thermomicrobiales bacterium]|uniref:Uncharacterized protein n=1 Tax=uncultured Thermomicrobiales bacterium TaxID=1645740 RepID=A0A6J4V3E1_9BACT|nr:MAG: hypothetical protein AVDCRST_MAG19-2513 [uncultured Thermomicrobiales bacterium]
MRTLERVRLGLAERDVFLFGVMDRGVTLH